MEIKLQGSQNYFYAVLKEVPIQRNGEVRLLPIILLCRDGSTPQVLKEAIDYTWQLSNQTSTATLRKRLASLTQLMNFIGSYFSQYSSCDEHFEDFILHFVGTRITGTLDEENRCRYGNLNWNHVTPNTARMDLVYVLSFFDYCAERTGELSVLDNIRIVTKGAAFTKLLEAEEQKGRDFLIHLQNSRDFWRRLRGEEKTKLPPIAPRVMNKPKTFKLTPSAEEVNKIIGATSNPVYKAIFILAAFGGMRISEILNLWVCDVLDGNEYLHFFSEPVGDPNRDCLVLRCHPVHSEYCGKLNDFRQKRADFLSSIFDLVPRQKLSSQDRLYSGWKGTISTGDGGVHPVYWIDPNAAHVFRDCYGAILKYQQKLKAKVRHPYLFINIADRSGKYNGQPTTISGVQNAFEAACKRCGLQSRRNRLSIHSLRHFYKWYAAEVLKLEPHLIQVMLGHLSIYSQEEYGHRMSEIGEVLSNGIQNIKGSVLVDEKH